MANYGHLSVEPKHLYDYAEEQGQLLWEFEPSSKKAAIRLVIAFPGEVVHNWYVIVETWTHLVGSKRRKYLSEFTEPERKMISKYHKYIYNWYLRTGSPKEVAMKLTTYNLMNRAANFFATI